MQRIIAAALLFVACMAALAADKPNPADFTLTAHTLSSRNERWIGDKGSFYALVLDVTINGQEMEILSNQANSEDELLPVQDYPAKVAPSSKAVVKYVPAYKRAPHYTLLMPDGKTMDFVVVRLGAPPAR